jgi:hypothetical protein
MQLNTLTAKDLYKTVSALGLTRAQVRSLLPAWWEPAIEQSPDGAGELAMHLSRRLSLDLKALTQGSLTAKGAVTQVAFKHRADANPDSLAASSFIASSLSQAVLAAMTTTYEPLPPTVGAIQKIVPNSTKEIFGFDALLDLCWDRGIPVVPLPNLPVGIRKMDGAALMVGDRPAIVIARKKSSRAWLSFILSHEIGHIALKHLQPSSSIIDISLQETSTYAVESSADRQEAEADAFALHLMGGGEVDNEIAQWTATSTPVEIAVLAREASAKLRIEAGHFVLRHAFRTKRWAESVTALGFLSEDFDPQTALTQQLKKRLDMQRIAPDLQDLVTRITGWDGKG